MLSRESLSRLVYSESQLSQLNLSMLDTIARLLSLSSDNRQHDKSNSVITMENDRGII